MLPCLFEGFVSSGKNLGTYGRQRFLDCLLFGSQRDKHHTDDCEHNHSREFYLSCRAVASAMTASAAD
jgi:hypothetical protein